MGEAAEKTASRQAPTPRQQRLARTIQKANSRTQALLEAGYGPGTARGSAKRTLETAGVQSQIETLAAKELDSASRVHNLGLQAFERRIKDDSISDAGIAAAVKVTHDIKQADAGTDQLLTGADREAANTYIRAVVRACFAASCERNNIGLIDLDDATIDSIAVAVERGELTQCTLSDAIPPSAPECVNSYTPAGATDTVADNAVGVLIVGGDE